MTQKKKFSEYVEARKSLDEYVKGLHNEIHLNKKQPKTVYRYETDLKKNSELKKLRMESTNFKKRSLEREIIILKEIDRIKKERDFYKDMAESLLSPVHNSARHLKTTV